MQEKLDEIDKIKKQLADIDEKLSHVIGLQMRQLSRTPIVPDTLRSLPEHLQRTALTVAGIGEASAEEVSRETGRTRAAESDYLNQLAHIGLLRKKRRGREIRFRVYALYTKCASCDANVLITMDFCPMCGASLSKSLSSPAPRIS